MKKIFTRTVCMAMCAMFAFSIVGCKEETPSDVVDANYQWLDASLTDTSQLAPHCDLMNHSTSGLPVHHQLPEFTQTHVHRVSDAIQPSHPLSSPSPPAPNPSQHQSLFQ